MGKTTIKVLDKGFVRIEEVAGTDLSIVNAAKVSFDKRSKEFGNDERKILHFLIREKHTSPLEHTMFRFHVKVPKVVVSEWHRHRIGVSYNEVSGRYVSFEDREFYIPDHLRVQKGKPGNYRFERLKEDPTRQSMHLDFVAWLEWMGEQFRDGYKYFAGMGIAKEQLRLPIPFNFYTEMVFTCNVHSLMHFLTLRLGPNAMWEIRQYGLALAEFFAESFPEAWAAFKEHRLSDTMDFREWRELP